ncbi:hypothetical protein PHSY_000608 [Pseudozyma hubeiensis SY62]|uniref:Uncharacterized protein n=1 Tax=Pseudozyma hubeiensis (strain SY62) TaxID=1305764 RepID=R9NX07_PSEHS|nr:hypothetical protein PHSY_000608 [Pseudozyma hubeiensis SY62]GAC93047.1 hypothetical protein PHSY_000608 [Pseudozyma hubeiensis SY62]
MRISLLTIATFALLLGYRFGLVSSVGPGFVENGLTRFVEQLPLEHLPAGEDTSTDLHAFDPRSYFAVPGSSSINTVIPVHQQALNTGELDLRLTQYRFSSSSNLPVHGFPLPLENPRSHWQTSYTRVHHDGRLASSNHEPIPNVLLTPNAPRHISNLASFQSQTWSPTSFLKIDSAFPDPLLQQNAQEGHQGLAISQGTDTHATSGAIPSAKRWRRNGAAWSEEQKARWVRQRMSYSKQEPQYLRSLPYVFPDQPWLKRAKMQVWERPFVQQYVASQAFDDQLTWPESDYHQAHSVSGDRHAENSAFAFADSLLVDPYESEAETSFTGTKPPSNEASMQHVQPYTTHQDSHAVGPEAFVAQGQAVAQSSSGSSSGSDAHSLIAASMRRLNPNGGTMVVPRDTSNRYWTVRKLKEFGDSPVRKRFREPDILKMLEYSLPTIQVDAARRFRYRESGDEARNEINSRVFNNRLVWADMIDMSAQAKRSHRKMAFGPSRVLPFVKLPTPSESRMEQKHLREVRMTVHGAGVDSKTWPRDHPFVGQTYMEFFSMPDLRSPEDQSTIIQRHGVGYLDTAYHGEVDGFLLSALKKV